jgi:DNA modification methylase
VQFHKTGKRNTPLAVMLQPQLPFLDVGRGLGEILPTAGKPEDVTAGFRDPSFGQNKQYPLHRWVPWVAGFSAHFVHDCLKTYLPPERQQKAWVLDPFSGVGTTLVESYLHGFNVVGFEINPYAVLATKTKLEAGRVSAELLREQIRQYEMFMDENSGPTAIPGRTPTSSRPEGFSGRTELYAPAIETKVLFTLDFIKSIKNKTVKNLFKLAFGSVMVTFSHYTYEPSLTRRASVGKSLLIDADVKTVLAVKLKSMLDDVVWMQAHTKRMRQHPKFNVVAGSFLSARKSLGKSGFVDIAITSPPYLNNYHYPRNTRPQIQWLGFSNKRGYEGANESLSFGKFWQTVRDLPEVKLTFKLPELSNILKTVRSLNGGKNEYGGSGWANYIATYFNDTYRFCKVLKSMLRPNGVAVIVLGNSIIQGVEVQTDQIFGKIAMLCGLKFEKTIMLRNKRTGSSIIQSSVRVDKAKQKTVLYESAIVLRRAK